MVAIKKMDDLYEKVCVDYGERKCWISELAEELAISYSEANALTLALGYRRGRCTNPEPKEVFANNPLIQRILAQIQAGQHKAQKEADNSKAEGV